MTFHQSLRRHLFFISNFCVVDWIFFIFLVCDSPPIEYTNGLTSNIPLLAVYAGTHLPAHIICVIRRMKMIIKKIFSQTRPHTHTHERRNATTAQNPTSNENCARSPSTATFLLAWR
ncbi:hypothetical protein Tsp_05489, partial [Trichinella spiralis]|uniref:hypothetical protein n=1 Tax=Trichinella spiralis TaxID=6334 RepID=UPI0001EFD9A0